MTTSLRPITRGSAWGLVLKLYQDRARTEVETLPDGALARVQIRARDNTSTLLLDCTIANGRVTVTVGDAEADPPVPATINIALTATDTRDLVGTRGTLGVEIQPTSNPNDFYELAHFGVLFEPETVYD